MAYELTNLDLPTQKIMQFYHKKINTVEELAKFFPRKYFDFRQVKTVGQCTDGDICAVKGRIYSIDAGDDRVLRAWLRDDQGYDMGINWYHSKYLANVLRDGEEYYICGKVSLYFGRLYMNAPICFSTNAADVARIMPVYSKIKGMSNDYLLNSIDKAIAFMKVNHVPGDKDLFAKKIGLVELFTAYRYLHTPKNIDEYKLGRRRMDYELMYEFYENLGNRSKFIRPVSGFQVQTAEFAKNFVSNLPFELTDGQVDALKEIWNTMDSGARLEALITGDVGCGKTMVAMIASLFAYENHGQCTVMAPTLVLAKQHYEEFSARLEPFGINCALLTGETKKRERTKILKALKNGEVDILLGTHAVLAEDVVFHNLALTIVDEEHKFGVSQKKAIEKMDANGVHHLAMTATPIPRSLAMTIYGNRMKVIQIRTLPAGRKPVMTRMVDTPDKGYAGIVEEVEAGHQAYVICPFIHDSESEKFKDVSSVETIFDDLTRYCRVHRKPLRIEYISGDMKQSDIVAIIERFANKEFDVLLSTTIVEVGVNVPNATAIMIMSAERFGLAALHQLRGRVGRCSDQAYCYLSSQKDSPKFDLFCATTDGFVIAEEDMKMRGPGDLTGEEQAGYSKVIDLILRRPKMAAIIREHLLPC